LIFFTLIFWGELLKNKKGDFFIFWDFAKIHEKYFGGNFWKKFFRGESVLKSATNPL
jgi:hypothetical protein